MTTRAEIALRRGNCLVRVPDALCPLRTDYRLPIRWTPVSQLGETEECTLFISPLSDVTTMRGSHCTPGTPNRVIPRPRATNVRRKSGSLVGQFTYYSQMSLPARWEQLVPFTKSCEAIVRGSWTTYTLAEHGHGLCDRRY